MVNKTCGVSKVQTGIEPSPFKVRELPARPVSDAVYYVINSNKTVSIYVTDKNGTPFPVGVPVIIPDGGINQIYSSSGTIDVVRLGNIVDINIKQEIIDKLNSLQSDKHYEHDQPIAADIWICNHNLGKEPAVTIVDTTGREIEGEVDHMNGSGNIDKNTTTIYFNYKIAGTAYFN